MSNQSSSPAPANFISECNYAGQKYYDVYNTPPDETIEDIYPVALFRSYAEALTFVMEKVIPQRLKTVIVRID